jgi:hypothetical protein
MSGAKPPAMVRSRSQLASAYAPHHPFTFEGGEGACITVPSPGNRDAALRDITRRTIADQIQEYCEAWARRGLAANGLRHTVALEQTIDRSAMSGDAVHVRYGNLVFQTPETIGYVPFPLTFVCKRCGLYRNCDSLKSAVTDISRFPAACPTGSANCANDWQQLDVVMTHWSGEVEPITPSYRYWYDGTGGDPTAGGVRTISNCASCSGNRFYLQRPPGNFSAWHFECVSCHTVRPMLQRDKRTLELLGPLLAPGQAEQAFPAEINMEPISYRASAVHYTHGDRLLVFDDDQWLGLLAETRTAELASFLASRYNYPVTPLTDAERERVLRDAGKLSEWVNYVGSRDLLRMVENLPTTTPEMLAGLRGTLSQTEAKWNETVFAGRQSVAAGIDAACSERGRWIRRYDFVRMAAEHRTLEDEKLHSGRKIADGKDVSVDVSYLDPFLKPDHLSPADEARMLREVRRRLALLGIAEMRLVRDVRVCEYTFGYSRTESNPTVRREEKLPNAEMPVRLRLHGKVQVGDNAAHPVLCIEQSNEGFYVRLDVTCVEDWLSANAIPLPVAAPGVSLGGRLIEDFADMQANDGMRFSRFLDEYRREHAVPRRAAAHVFTLLHTAAHHLISVASAMSGLDLGSFGEHLFVPDLAFLIYRRGSTMDLGNLSSMWRERGSASFGNEVLEKLIDPSSLRCGSESVCNHRGGACPDCLLIPESACLTRNELLSRSALVGRGHPWWDADASNLVGYLDIAARRYSSGTS